MKDIKNFISETNSSQIDEAANKDLLIPDWCQFLKIDITEKGQQISFLTFDDAADDPKLKSLLRLKYGSSKVIDDIIYVQLDE